MDAKLIRFVLEQAEPLAVTRRIEIYKALYTDLTDREQRQEIATLIEDLQRIDERSQQILFSFPR
jgi:hypothetical protein